VNRPDGRKKDKPLLCEEPRPVLLRRKHRGAAAETKIALAGKKVGEGKTADSKNNNGERGKYIKIRVNGAPRQVFVQVFGEGNGSKRRLLKAPKEVSFPDPPSQEM